MMTKRNLHQHTEYILMRRDLELSLELKGAKDYLYRSFGLELINKQQGLLAVGLI